MRKLLHLKRKKNLASRRSCGYLVLNILKCICLVPCIPKVSKTYFCICSILYTEDETHSKSFVQFRKNFIIDVLCLIFNSHFCFPFAVLFEYRPHSWSIQFQGFSGTNLLSFISLCSGFEDSISIDPYFIQYIYNRCRQIRFFSPLFVPVPSKSIYSCRVHCWKDNYFCYSKGLLFL